jgi:hypothetical protein
VADAATADDELISSALVDDVVPAIEVAADLETASTAVSSEDCSSLKQD